MSTLDPEALGARAYAMISELASISAEPTRLVRQFLTPEHRRAADLVASWMQKAGLAVSEDALGTLRGRFGTSRRRLLIGSHIDTVIDAGKYDGPLGVIAGILAAEPFAKAKAKLPFGIDVLAFGDEEGSRFPATMTSSSACAGVFEPEALSAADAKGVTLTAALRAYGKMHLDIPAAAYRPQDAAAYVEVHIEQGPVLEARGEPLGVVTGIVGQTRLRVTVTGEAGHAGTVPMALRHDAFAGAAEMTLALERIAREHPEDGMVGTVGRIEAMPGAVNIVPGRVVFTVDLRSLTDELRIAAVERFTADVQGIAQARGLKADRRAVSPGRHRALRAAASGRARCERDRTRPQRDPAAVGRGPRRADHVAALPRGDAVRALPRRHQPQPGGVRQRVRHGARDRGADPVYREIPAGLGFQPLGDPAERSGGHTSAFAAFR